MSKERESIIKKNVSFAELGSYRLGGSVAHFAAPKSEEELREVLHAAKENNWPILVIGGGTNILMGDDGFSGLVIRPDIFFIEKNKTEVCVGAGVFVADLLSFAIENNLGNLEWAGGLPGSVGGGVRGNAGCFGGEMKDVIKEVESLDTQTGEKKIRNRDECLFSYRSSIFKNKLNDQEIILSATFSLAPKDGKLIKAVADEHIQYRKDRQPLDYPNIGSIFKNVDVCNVDQKKLSRFNHVIKQDPFPVIPTAYLISEAGLKGVSCGGAMISPKHPNFIINVLEAKAADVKNLIKLAQSEVKKKFGIDIEPEVIEI